MVAALAFNPSSDPPRSLLPEEITWLGSLSYNEQGLIPAIVQDYLDGTVLMVAWMNRESLQKTLETGRTWFWSRSRQALWPKGETSGHVQWVKQIRYDCDGDALVILVEVRAPMMASVMRNWLKRRTSSKLGDCPVKPGSIVKDIR